jgi:hypothetical protein
MATKTVEVGGKVGKNLIFWSKGVPLITKRNIFHPTLGTFANFKDGKP